MPETSEKWERNQQDVRGDGRVMIYQRPRRDGAINPTWHMRLLLTNQSGYFKGSARTPRDIDAIRISLNKFDEFQARALSGGTLRKICPPPLSWSTPIVMERRTRDGEQATQTGRDCHKVAAG